MSPRLVAIRGPLSGSSFELGEGETSLGRHPSNRIQVPDISVYPHHCVIREVADGFRVVSPGSPCCTFINQLPVREELLTEGDLLTLGRTSFRFVTAEPARERGEVRLSQHPHPHGTRASVEIPVTNPFDRPVGSLRHLRARPVLSALLEMSSRLTRLGSVEAIEGQVLQTILGLIPADRAGIVLLGPGGDEVTSTLAVNREGTSEMLHLSRSIFDRALTERLGLLCRNLEEGDDAGDGGARCGGTACLCVPLLSGEEPLGVLYLDSGDPEIGFEEEDLRVVTGIAGIAAAAIENARRFAWLEGERQRLELSALDHNMVGASDGMRRVFETIARVAPTESTVLIRGESGTGKELAALAIHNNSARAARPFVAINCASLSAQLLESELFGHEKGAFTGAVRRKIGKLEVARGGTVFLDEVGEIAASLQPKLLRVLEARQFERVGGTSTIPADIRVVAASNKDLEVAIADGSFREDLYYRLNVISIHLPPLRERRDDIPLLASHFAALHAANLNRPPPPISPKALVCLGGYDWPGNVRELANYIERAVVLSRGEAIRVEDLPDALWRTRGTEGSGTLYGEAIEELKRQLVIDAVQAEGGNVSAAARRLGLHPNYLHRLIRKLDLRARLRG